MIWLGLEWQSPWFFLLLPLVLLPWINSNQDKVVVWKAIIPVDPLSTTINLTLKSLVSILFLCLIIAMVDPAIPQHKVERVGAGAEVVILLDRSRSMDEPFAPKGQPANYTYNGKDAKRHVAGRFLTEFVKGRPDDRFGFVFFSNKAINLLPLTYNKKAVLSTINASALGRGLSKTNMAEALLHGAKMFDGQTYRGSRIVLLVSDGGQKLTKVQKQKIIKRYKAMHLSIYWIYMSSVHGMTLDPGPNDDLLWVDKPERKLHAFFKSIGIPYQAFEANSLETFAKAIQQINKQQYQPLIVEETVPHQSRKYIALWIALLAATLLAASWLYTLWGVRKAHE